MRETVTIVAPVHNEEQNISFFIERIQNVFLDLDFDYRIIFVDDGSSDNSFQDLERHCKNNLQLQTIKLSRNFGHQNAVSCGLQYAKGDCTIIIDTDLQDPPEVIPALLALWRKGYKNVYGVRRSRAGESSFKKITAKLFYRLLNKLTDFPIPLDTGDFRLIDKVIVNELNLMREEFRFLRGGAHVKRAAGRCRYHRL